MHVGMLQHSVMLSKKPLGIPLRSLPIVVRTTYQGPACCRLQIVLTQNGRPAVRLASTHHA